jgi:hypothetical protein
MKSIEGRIGKCAKGNSRIQLEILSTHFATETEKFYGNSPVSV